MNTPFFFISIGAATFLSKTGPPARIVVQCAARDTPERYAHTTDPTVLRDLAGREIDTPIFRGAHTRAQNDRHAVQGDVEPEPCRFPRFGFDIEHGCRDRTRHTRLIERDRRHTHSRLVRAAVLFATTNAF